MTQEEQKKEEFRELEHQYYQKHMNIDEMGGCSMLLWTDEFNDLINAFYELGLKHGKNES